MIQLELEVPLGKALIEENSYSIVEINNATWMVFLENAGAYSPE